MKKIPEISPTFCVYPWMEFVLGPTVHIKLCCISETAVLNQEGRAYEFGKDSIEDYWNSYGLREARRKMLNGEKIKACEHCYYQESIGRSSYRQSFNKHWLKSKFGKDIMDRVRKSGENGYRVEKQPLYLDIRPGNLCNLKCRMCNPGSSSKIYQEQERLLDTNEPEVSNLIDTSYFKLDKKNFHNWHKNKEVWQTIYKWAPGVKQLYFTGGEPTLIKENWRLIDYLTEKGYSKNIDLIFNINCTQAPQKLLNTFKNFSTVTVTFSIDGFKEAQEYIRHPSKWENIEQNIIKILRSGKTNTFFYFSPVVQVYNILHLPDLLRWMDDISLNYRSVNSSMIMCTRPRMFDIKILPKSVKHKALSGIEEYERSYKGSDQFLLECLGSVKNVLRAEEKTGGMEKDLKKFYKYTKLLDKNRNNNFEKTFPELNRLLDEDGRWKNYTGPV